MNDAERLEREMVPLPGKSVAKNRPMQEGLGFHWRDGIMFERQPDGSVDLVLWYRLPLSAPGKQWNGHRLGNIPAGEWASIIASVSASGETAEKYQEANAFHG